MDIKGMYQNEAEKIARDKYVTEFYDLPEACQQVIYNQAIENVIQDLVYIAEHLYC